MAETELPPLDDANWDVPAFDCVQLRPRATRYCIVIPIINEGARMIGQLEDMARLGQMDLADVILADGGSTDGSTDPDLLTRLGISALLVKRGPGTLSAQLRMAYAWALRQGYTGIITIDGNGKDGVETVPAFIAALDAGIDYAQASRFLPGGVAINTPVIRDLAIRLIHAPALSLAAGKRFTDTTQGYRAYSARYLLHPAVQPFRAVFSRYELLAYLTVRADQLGLATTEIATTRRYPDDGTVPTKIHAVRGNLDLMATLWKTVTGQYNPPRRG
jgi:dolichol-phosphate mannosyltransferase